MRPLGALSARAGRVCALAVVIAVAGNGSALGHFRANGTGAGAATVGALGAPVITAATPGAGTVALAWSAVSPPGGTGTVRYGVTRDGGPPGGDCPPAGNPTTATTCTDDGLSAGTYRYRVGAHWRTWTSTGAATAVTVASGAATHFVLSAASTSVQAGQPDALTIVAKDADGITVTAYTGDKSLTFTGAGAIGVNRPSVTDRNGTARDFGTAATITFVNGVATVSGTSNGVMRLPKAETAHIVVSDGSIDNGSGLAVTVSAAAAAQLAFTRQPSSSTGGIAFAAQPQVTVRDQYGNTATLDTSSVTLAITTGTGTAGAALTCTSNPVAAVAGVATFAGCAVDKAGTDYTLTATDGALAPAVSSAFTISVGPPAKLAFTQQPSGGTAAVAFPTQPAVAVQDAGGNVVTTDTSSVTLGITAGTGTAGAVLTCTSNPVAVAAGVATFAGCAIDRAGSGYTLIATDSALVPATSTAFDVTAPPISWVVTGTTATANRAGNLAPPIPASLAVNDLMLLIVANTTQNVSNAPSGWTLAGRTGTNAGAGISLSVFYRLFQTGVTAPSVAVNTDAGGASARIVAYRNVNATTPLDTAAVTSTSAAGQASFTPTGLTTVTANAAALSIAAENDGANTAPTLSFANAQGFSAVSGFPEQPAVGNGGNHHALVLAGRIVASPASLTFPTFATDRSGVWAGTSLALRP